MACFYCDIHYSYRFLSSTGVAWPPKEAGPCLPQLLGVEVQAPLRHSCRRVCVGEGVPGSSWAASVTCEHAVVTLAILTSN